MSTAIWESRPAGLFASFLWKSNLHPRVTFPRPLSPGHPQRSARFVASDHNGQGALCLTHQPGHLSANTWVPDGSTTRASVSVGQTNPGTISGKSQSPAFLTFLAISSRLPFPHPPTQKPLQLLPYPRRVELTAARCRRRLGASGRREQRLLREERGLASSRDPSHWHARLSTSSLAAPRPRRSGASRTPLAASPPPSHPLPDHRAGAN